MGAIITNDFRKNSRKNFIDNIISSQRYFVGIGKSDPWPVDDNDNNEDSSLFSVPLPQNTIAEKRDAINNLQTLVRVQSTFTLMPRNEWVAGRRYKVYDPTDPNTFNVTEEDGVEFHPCYVSYNNKVYVCLDNNQGGQSLNTIPSDYIAFKDEINDTFIRNSTGPDGYVWAFLQLNTQTTNDAFYTSSFIPVLADLDPVSQIADVANAKTATGGLVYGFKIINGGTGVLPTDAITLVGQNTDGSIKNDVLISDGVTSTDFAVTIDTGEITEVIITDLVTARIGLLNYSQASVVVANHPEVDIVPFVAPADGFGYSPAADLPSWFAGITSNFDGNVETEALTNTSFRQITLVKNPERNILEFDNFAAIEAQGDGEDNTFYIDNATGDVYTWNGSNYILEVGLTEPDNDNAGPQYGPADAYDALYYFTYDSGAGGITREYEVGTIITQPATGAKAFLDAVDIANERIYFHQNSSPDINLKPFDPAETSIELLEPDAGSPDAAVFVSVEYPEHVHNTGDVMFLENRKRIDRDPNQNEQIKLVIQF